MAEPRASQVRCGKLCHWILDRDSCSRVVFGEEVGDLAIDISWKGVAPYLGIGLLKPFATEKFNVNLDLGTYYLNEPKSKITGTKLLADNYQLEPQLDKNMSTYRFLPVLQVNFNINIHKVLH